MKREEVALKRKNKSRCKTRGPDSKTTRVHGQIQGFRVCQDRQGLHAELQDTERKESVRREAQSMEASSDRWEEDVVPSSPQETRAGRLVLPLALQGQRKAV